MAKGARGKYLKDIEKVVVAKRFKVLAKAAKFTSNDINRFNKFFRRLYKHNKGKYIALKNGDESPSWGVNCKAEAMNIYGIFSFFFIASCILRLALLRSSVYNIRYSTDPYSVPRGIFSFFYSKNRSS